MERYECKDKAALDAAFGDVIFDESIRLYNILPRISGEVTLIPVIYSGRGEGWRSLGLIQNEAVAILASTADAPRLNAAHRLYHIALCDVVTFDEERDVLGALSLYVDPLPVPQLTDDLPGLQWQVVHGPGLWGKCNLGDGLPEFRCGKAPIARWLLGIHIRRAQLASAFLTCGSSKVVIPLILIGNQGP